MYMKRTKNNHADTLYIYSVYDLNEELVMTGPLDDVIEYLGLTRRKSFFETASKWKKSHKQDTTQGMKLKKHYVYFEGTEKITEKKCIKCGKVKPLSEFPMRTSSSGEVVTRNLCKRCHSIYTTERRKKK